MALLTRELIASYAFIERNFFLTKRYWGWEIAWLVYATASALAIAFIGVDQGDPVLVLSLMIGAVFWNFLSIVFGFIAETVAWERWEGTLEYTFMAPVRRWAQLLGSTSYAVLYALVQTFVMLIVLALFFGLMPAVGSATGLVGAFALFGFAMAGVNLGWSLGPLHFASEGRAHMYTAVHFSLVGVRSVFAPLLGFLVKDHFSYAAAFGLSVAFVLVAAATVWRLAREHG